MKCLNALFLFFSLLALPLLTLALPDLDLPDQLPDEPIDIRAARMEYTNGFFIATGGVTGRFERATILADRVKGNPETGDLHAEGNVHFTRDKMEWSGTTLDYNYKTQTGTFGPSEFYLDPILLTAKKVDRVATNEFYLQDATFTTCTNHPAHYHISVREAHLVDQKYLKAKGATFYIGKTPILYLPYWNHRMKQSVFAFKLGYGSEWGAYALTTTTLPITPEIDSITDINPYSKRGLGIGQGFTWNYPDAVGQFASFYLRDNDPNSRFDSPEISEDRYRFKFEHLQNFSDTHYLNTKWNYLSDPFILEEFFKDEYEENVQPENYGSWVFGNHFIGAEAFESYALNDFYDNINRTQASANLYRTKLSKTPFYLQSENAVADLKHVYSSTNAPLPSYSSVRLDSANTIYLPWRFAFLNVVPRAGYRATYYSDTTVENGEGGQYRQVLSAGLETSFQATRIFSERNFWFGTGLRHKIEPYTDYIYDDTSVETNQLLQFDHVDAISNTNALKIGVRNVLQTKRNHHLARLLDLDLYTYWLIDQNDSPNSFDNLYLRARIPLTANLLLIMEGRYDWYESNIPFFDTRLSYDTEDIIVSLEHLYETGKRSLWTPEIELFPDQRFSLEAYLRYEDKSNDVEEFSITAYMNRCCMRYGLGYHTYDDGEQRVMFSIGLAAFPSAHISTGF